MNDIKRLKMWLQRPGNNAVKLAFKLDYKSSVTITQWIMRGRIPDKDRAKVLKIVESGLKKENSL